MANDAGGAGASDYGKYDFNQRVFPSDLGGEGSYNNHWLVININVQNDTIAGPAGGGGTQFPGEFTPLPGVLSNSDKLRYQDLGIGPPRTGLEYLASLNYATRPRFTTRIKESIALYMPNSEMTFSDNHDFQNISLTKFAMAPAAGAFAGVVGATAALTGANAAEAVQVAGAITDSIGNIIGNASSVVFNRPINPRVELLFSNTFQREFTFDFLFAPSSEEESVALWNIIRTLRFHAAPEARGTYGSGANPFATDGLVGSLFNGGVNGAVSGLLNGADAFFWVPPSEFDITFYHNGKENNAIPKINTCVLKSVDVSYAPASTYSTFSNGYPVQTRMVLRFQEVEVTHKQRVAQGY